MILTKTKTVTSLIYAIFLLFSVSANAQESEIKTELLWKSNVAPDAGIWGVYFSPAEKYIIAEGGQSWYIVDPENGKKLSGIPNGRIERNEGTRTVLIRERNTPFFIHKDTILLLESYDKQTIEFHSVPDLKVIASLEKQMDK